MLDTPASDTARRDLPPARLKWFVTELGAIDHFEQAIPAVPVRRILIWFVVSVLFTAGAMVMMIRGVAVSTKLAGFFFVFELVVLLVVAVATLIMNGGHLSFAPFEPKNITNGFSGLAAGFPLAVYLFIGWENSAALAEETDNPRRNVPRAVFMSIALMAVTYLLLAYSTVSGFNYNGKALASAEIPFITVAHDVAGWLAFFAYMAGMTSTLGVLIAAVNSQCRLIFNAGREGLLQEVARAVDQVSTFKACRF